MGNYAASNLAAALGSLLQTRFPEYGSSCNHKHNVGTIGITSSINSSFRIMTNGFVASVKDSAPFWYGGLPGVEIGQLDCV